MGNPSIRSMRFLLTLAAAAAAERSNADLSAGVVLIQRSAAQVHAPNEQLKAPPPTPPAIKTNATAAELEGIAQNQAGDLVAFLTATAFTSIMTVLFLLAICVLRRLYPMVYANNVLEGKTPVTPDDSLFGWVSLAWNLKTSDIVDCAGLDQAMHIEFNKFAMHLLVVLGVPLVLIMGPLHCFFGGGRSGNDNLSKWGVANVVEGHPWLFWVHAGLVWYVVIVVQALLFEYMRAFLKRRKKFLMEMPEPRATTILVEGIPPETCSDKRLYDYFSSIFGKGAVESAFVVMHTEKLINLREKMNAATQALKAAKEEETSTGIRATFLTVMGSRHDTIEYYQDLSKDLKKRVETERQRVFDEAVEQDKKLEEKLGFIEEDVEESAIAVPQLNVNLAQFGLSMSRSIYCTTGFVTFKSRKYSELALCSRITSNGDAYRVSVPPDPTDVIYIDLRKDPKAAVVHELVGYGLVAGLFVSFVPFVVGISTFCNLGDLATKYPGSVFEYAVQHYSAVTTVWDALAGSIALELFMSFLPTLLVLIFSSFFALKAEAWVQHSVQTWYFCFLVTFVLLATAIGVSLMKTTRSVFEDPFSVFALLAEHMPLATHFYLSYIPLQWSQTAKNGMRTTNLGKFLTFRIIYEAEDARKMSEPEDQDYYGLGSRSARQCIILVIVLVFCTLSPLITILGFINFAISKLVYSYLIVFAETPKPDLGGVFWVTQLEHVQKCMFIFIILMTGVILQRSSTPAPAFIAGFAIPAQALAYNTFKKDFNWVTLSLVDARDAKQRVKRVATRGTYMQPEMVKVEDDE